MKKVMVFVMVMAITLLGTALGESILKETTLTEQILTEQMLDEEFIGMAESELEKLPNYVVTIGGPNGLIDVQVIHHFGWIVWVGNAWDDTTEFCSDVCNNVGNTVSTTTTNVVNTVKGWIGNIGK